MKKVTRLDASRRKDFYRLNCPGTEMGWCFCVAWWVPTWNGWGERTEGQNKKLRDELFDRGEYDGYLLYVQDKPAGWCQVGPRDRLQKLVGQFKLKPDPSAWAITCFAIAPEHRRQGLASFMLAEILLDLKERGAKRVEAFPKRESKLEPGALWNGAEAMYVKAGFKVVQEDLVRPVLALEI